MTLRKALLEEHSKSQRDKIVSYIGKDKAKFAELIRIFTGSDYRLTQRAAWPLSYCVRKYPELIQPYFSDMIGMLQKSGTDNAVTRNIIRLLQDVDIPEKYHGEIMNICFDFIQSNDAPAAIKAFSLTVLHNLSRHYPDIKSELKLIIEERWDYETAAFKSRARKVLKG
jgi:hypothetical protein